ncbi:MAG: hypothetical protein WBM63_13605 [Sedimenticolaceae bacterium]
MSMKVLRLYTYWEPGEACSALAFIDALREQITIHYGDEMAETLREASAQHDEQQLELPFIDLPPF